ncbi:MAG TPA: DUF1957 domain-containing protein [Bacillota bacterium]|jgi:1,4-alpha-glucan branching enzyme|nr:DUF1957 domain-containing protein [Bacillota bacterium]HOL10103.1 DUF1957 domain-containing protein [Bacillota bacterium]HPO98300.1 DUF1957 domain-containing protein [Bacillota bacterium]
MQFKQDTNSTGYLAFLLHAHLPYVHNTKSEISLEEKWLFEAITESYIPMLLSWEKLAKEGVPFQITLSLSPTLLSMLLDPDLPERYGRYLDGLKELTGREVERVQNIPEMQDVVGFYYDRIRTIDHAFRNEYQYNLVLPLKKLAIQGHLELITTCATHGFLPLMMSDVARRAQIRTGVNLFRQVFGWAPRGLWLPECAYLPGVEKLLKEEGIKYFIMSGHGLLNSVPKAATGLYAPLKTSSGVAVFGRDIETSQQVWSRTEGYPGDYYYREFYRDVGYDLDYDYIQPYLTAGIRGDTGLKYYRITGKTDYKEPYNRGIALSKAMEHAYDFVHNRNHQVAYWKNELGQKPLITAPYDAELFGHWWFEGPDWLENVLRIASNQENGVRTITFSNYLKQHPPRQTVAFGPSTWGDGGYNRFWLNNLTDWVYQKLHTAEKAMAQLADSTDQPTALERRLLNQAARELLLAQSSDWPFIITSQTVVDYAKRRIEEHLINFFKLCDQYYEGSIDEAELQKLEAESPIFADLDYRIYSERSPWKTILKNNSNKPEIIMLSWEFPPQHVGGLGIHVRDLSEALVKQGYNVHVLTVAHDGQHGFKQINGIAVHYLPTYQKLESDVDFMSWILQLNLGMADYAREMLMRLRGRKVIIHAHDWLVSFAARELKAAFNIPLVTTIHATESGRNNGLYNTTQQAIHRIESELASISDHVICCSQYMKTEIRNLFDTDPELIYVIPNGVRQINIVRKPNHNKQQLFFCGRLVREKGVQDLIQAYAGIAGLYPDSELLIAGSGPYMHELQDLTRHLNLESRVKFLGFISEQVRNQYLAEVNIAIFPSLYEPFGIVALEAMAAGVPVIASKTGGLGETVQDGVNGLTFTPGDVNELQRCLLKLIQSQPLADYLSVRSKEIVLRDYTWDAVARQTAQVYETAFTQIIAKVS